MPPTVADLMLSMHQAFDPESAAGIDAAIQFKFMGDLTSAMNLVVMFK